MTLINIAVYSALLGRPWVEVGRAAKSGFELRGSGVEPVLSARAGVRANPGILAGVGVVGGHGSTVAVALTLVVIAAVVAVDRRRVRRSRRTDRAGVMVGLLWLVVIVGAVVLGVLVVRAIAGVFS